MDEPSTPNPQMTTLVYTALRALVTIAGALGLGVGAATDTVLMTVSGAIVTLVGVVWSFVQKYRASSAAHDSAVASAAAGTPINSKV